MFAVKIVNQEVTNSIIQFVILLLLLLLLLLLPHIFGVLFSQSTYFVRLDCISNGALIDHCCSRFLQGRCHSSCYLSNRIKAQSETGIWTVYYIYLAVTFLIGLKVEDFGQESHGEMVIEFLQMKHRCVIAIQGSATDARYYILFQQCLYDFIMSRIHKLHPVIPYTVRF